LESCHKKIEGPQDLIAIWVHETTRVFSDRLVDDADRTSFHQLIADECNTKFNVKTTELTQTPTLLFCDFYEENNEAKPYIQVRDQKVLETVLNAAMADYDELNSKKLALVLFPDAIEHVVRISRIIRQPSGHALLLGVGGSGRQSLTRLAAHIAEYQIFQPEITKTYGTVEWLADIRTVMKKSGFEEQPTVFLVSDAQIVNESFLEDLNNLLNSGDVPNIFPPEDTEEIVEKMKPIAQARELQMSKLALHALFISRVKASLHIVLALSPIGEAFRRRLRMFPSLVTCTSIDWFSDWSKDALRSVALDFFSQIFVQDALIEVASEYSVRVHSSVIETSGQLLAAEKSHNYVTPTSFLDFLQLIKSLIDMKIREMNRVKSSMETGLASLQVAEQSVNELQEQIRALQPQLEQLTKETETAMERIQIEEAKASQVRKTVEEEATINKAKAIETQKLEAEAKIELDKVLPVLEEAQRGVGNLTTKAIATVRSYLRPPEAVANVMQGVCILLSQDIVRVPGA
jgi:dynein heavy chain